MKKILTPILTVLFTHLFFSACATPPSLKRLDFSEIGEQATLAMARIEVKSSGRPLENCLMRIKKTGEMNPLFLPLDLATASSQGDLIAEVPSGEYRFEALVCRGQGTWELGPSFKIPATVRSGKIQFLGWIRLEYNSEKDSLKAKLANRAESTDAALRLLKKVPADQRKRVVSAFSGGPLIESALTERKIPKREVNVKKEKSAGALKTDELNQAFSVCEDGEAELNPIQIGLLSYEAHYTEAGLQELKQTGKGNTFTSRFMECVETAFKNYRPYDPKEGSGKVEYRVVF